MDRPLWLRLLPRWFREDPAFAWGFYGHRRNLYRETQPHAGFRHAQGGFKFDVDRFGMGPQHRNTNAGGREARERPRPREGL